ncbi:hypothetical protein [Nocardia sp. NPDC048505]|uniref:hypothetical protein n=1 Tax=unclassified Nocardia TaxID=2637762 RepID=UPI0033E839DA
MDATEFGRLLVDPDPALRRQARAVMDHDDRDDLFGHAWAAVRVLREEEHAYAWPDALAALRTLRYPWNHFEMFVDKFAWADDSGFRDRLAEFLGVPAGVRFPEFPPAAEPEPGIPHWGWKPEGADPRRCRHVAALVALLDSSAEWVREAAFATLATGGLGLVGVLREVRNRPSRARGAAVGILAEFGWHLLDPADLALVHRLIRMKQATETPVPVVLYQGWYALPTTDQAAVLDAFGLCDPIPATLRMGFAAWRNLSHESDPGRRPFNLFRDLYRYDDGWGSSPYHYPEAFVSPALDGWTLVVADWPPGDDPGSRCAELSRRFGAAHFYEQGYGDPFFFASEWCVAENGEIRMYCFVSDDEGVIEDGVVDYRQPGELGPIPTREAVRAWLEANDHGRGHRTPPPRTLVPQDVNALRRRFGRDPLPEDKISVTIEEPCAEWDIGVEGAAPRLSVLPQTLGPHTDVVGTGVLAVPIAARNRVRMGSMLI